MIALGQQSYFLFDGDCGICTSAAEAARRIDRRHRFVIAPYQRFSAAELQPLGLSYEQCAKKVRIISRRGRVYAGAFGINYFLFSYFPWSLLVILIYALPVLLLLEVIGYAWVAKHRHRLSEWLGMKACALRQ